MDIYDIVDNPEKQLEVFSGIIKRMNASNDHDETLVTIISEIKTIMYTDSILLYLVDQELYNLHYEMSIGPLGSKFFGHIVENDKPLAVRAYTTSCSLYSNNPSDDSAFIPMKEILGDELQNILFVPLKVRKRNIGSLFLMNKKNGKFVEKDTVVMSLFANIVSLALVNKMVYDRAQSRAYEVGALYQMSISINKCETIEEILNDNISIVCEAFEAHRVSVILKENGVFKFKAGIGIDEDVLKYGVVTVDDNVLSEVLRTGNGGGLSGTRVFDNSGYSVNTKDIYACSSLDAVKIYFSLHRSLEDLDVAGTQDDLRYEVMLKTPLELKEGEPAELNSPAYYIVPQSDKAAIITIELNNDGIPEGFMYQLHEILGTTVDGKGSYDVRYFFPLGYNENGDLEIYVKKGQPEFWFNYYLSSPQGLCRKDDIGSISWRELSEEESAEIEDSFVTFNVSEEKSKTIQLDPDSRRFIPVIFKGNKEDDLKSLKISADSFDAVSNIRVVAFSEKGYSGQSIHNGKPSFDFSSENDQELELTYAYIEPRRYSSGNNSVTLSVEKV